MKFKIAVVQFRINQFQPEKNLKKAEQFIKEASGKADIIVFPEDFIAGPIESRLDEFADSEKKYCKFFQMLAKKYNIDIIPGSIIEKDMFGFFNTSYYIDSTGKIKSRYRKINLWHPEKRYLNPGNQISVFNTKYGKVGLIICWDIFFPELFRRMANSGAKIIFCPSYWTFEDASVGLKWDKNAEVNLVDSMCVGRAFENGMVVVYCNAVGKLILPKFKGTLFGHSQIAVPFKGTLKKLGLKEQMFIQEIDTSILDDAEKAYKIRSDLKKRVF